MTNLLNWSNQGWQKGDRENQAHAMGGYFHITTIQATEVLYDVDFNWMENRKGIISSALHEWVSLMT